MAVYCLRVYFTKYFTFQSCFRAYPNFPWALFCVWCKTFLIFTFHSRYSICQYFGQLFNIISTWIVHYILHKWNMHASNGINMCYIWILAANANNYVKYVFAADSHGEKWFIIRIPNWVDPLCLRGMSVNVQHPSELQKHGWWLQMWTVHIFIVRQNNGETTFDGVQQPFTQMPILIFRLHWISVTTDVH